MFSSVNLGSVKVRPGVRSISRRMASTAPLFRAHERRAMPLLTSHSSMDLMRSAASGDPSITMPKPPLITSPQPTPPPLWSDTHVAPRNELSFQTFVPGQDSGFLHTHHTHEELYIILKGEGQYQVDGDVIPVSEGAIIRVAPGGKRALRNTGSENLTVLCIQ